MARINRTVKRDKSNNPQNTNKNVCALAVAEALGCENNVHYLHVIGDVVRAVRMSYTVRSRGATTKGKSVGSLRKHFLKLSQKAYAEGLSPLGFIVRIPGHVIFVDVLGTTLTDTDPRKNDRRKVSHCYIVYAKGTPGPSARLLCEIS